MNLTLHLSAIGCQPLPGWRQTSYWLAGRVVAAPGRVHQRKVEGVVQHSRHSALCVVAIQRNVFSCSIKYELKLKMFLLSVSCFRVRVGGLRCNKISIKRQIKFENEESDASQSVGVRHLLIGLWHF